MKKLKLFAKGMTILIGLFAITTGSALADIVVKNGSTMRVVSGSSVVVSADVAIETGGTVNNSGTVTIRGDFTNDGTADLGSGEVVFNGTTLQNLQGTSASEFEDLTVNNSAFGVALGNDIRVDGTLALTTGYIALAAADLTLGEVSSISGTFSSSEMIVGAAAGVVRKEFADGTGANPAAFLFPIGDLSFNYTPITVDFSTGDFSSGSLSVNVIPSKEPNNSSSDNYLDRYWVLNTSGITNYLYDITATYVDGDIAGTEADITGALYDGSTWLIGDATVPASNTFSLNDFDRDGNATGVEFRILAGLGVLCEGPYNVSSNEMSLGLNSILPLDAATAYSHLGYSGTEAVAAIPSADIVDWILVEVRDATSPDLATSATTKGTVAGFLLRDGSIVGLDGTSALTFNALIVNNAYFVVYHRNHLPVMTAVSPTESFGNYIFDFSSAMANAYGTNPMKQIDTAPVVYGLFGGELNNSGTVTNADKVNIDMNMNVSGYMLGDVNFSGTVTNADKYFIDYNINISTWVPF